MVLRRTVVVVGVMMALVMAALAPALRNGRFLWREAEVRQAAVARDDANILAWPKHGTPRRAADEIAWPPAAPVAAAAMRAESRAFGEPANGYRVVSALLHA